MKCFQCREEIDESKPHEVTSPDGDVFHLPCLVKFEKERDEFFDVIIHDDKKFHDWLQKN